MFLKIVGVVAYVGMAYALTFLPDYCSKPVRPV